MSEGRPKGVKEKAIKKATGNSKTVKSSKAKDSNPVVSAKIDLREQLKSVANEGDFMTKVLSNFEKKLHIFQDAETVNLVRFLVYLIIKEKKVMIKRKHHPCSTCGCHSS